MSPFPMPHFAETPDVPAPPSGAAIQPIDFVGEWDSVVVPDRQINYMPNGFRVYLTEQQIDELIASRERMRRMENRRRKDVPYYHTETDDTGSPVLVQVLNGDRTIGVFDNGVFKAV